MKSHEYIVISGFNRSKVGKIIGSLASLISGVLVFLILTYLENNSYIEMKSVMTPTVSSLISAGTMYLILYWIFDSRLWKWKLISKVINVPNLSGEWDCEGRGENKEGDVFLWSAKIKIFQSWDKVHIRLQTSQSGSDSIAASIINDGEIGYRLVYNYRSDPRINEKELSPHMGFAELIFDKSLTTADGEYFNGRGRNTFGTMKLRRL
ncbi:Cap15 family cyclic dinucleotide receptor domain-containing protein [Klebsiella quasipneumoniae]|uniref:SMODS-associating 2TM beta-strand rich effector domain-containing protein n=2 Tax=Klebsiella quasipneumoniae TaxID=1463165 RepID=A0AAW8XM22_9ENTR|nr:hypothetical protein [Klebsiella quasipneumoniae]MBM5554556.1 hypothetical protein [Klebsiella quasipneumoniae]MBM5561098.1 hypothetical protein [Klebsiella quasipneumoniae]MDV0841425.1 hypothetical protein [Klebsiella quasipneumoniae subsp. quasipneumoniae]MDZ0791389.1 hypothetical protein [Klebsiella quasipneumoniae]BBK11905.1 hypothetical protein TMSI_22970 [Klebsiella quasipneumoniae]